MKKSLSRNLYLVGLVLAIIGSVLELTSVKTGSSGTAPSVSGLYLVGLAVAGVGGILAFVSWIGSLIKTAQLGRWGWFVSVLLLSWLLIPYLIYIFAGPEAPKTA